MRRRILSLLLAFAMVLGMIPVTAMAALTLNVAIAVGENIVSSEFLCASGGKHLPEGAECFVAEIPEDTEVTLTDNNGDTIMVTNPKGTFTATGTNGTLTLSGSDIQSALLQTADKEELFGEFPLTVEDNWVLLAITNNQENTQYLFLKVVESVTPSETFTVTLTPGDTYTIAATQESVSPVAYGGSYSFTVYPAQGYNMNNAVVKANDTILTPGDEDVYTITNITADQVVTVEGVEKTIENKKTVTVPVGAEVHVYYQNGYDKTTGNGYDKEIAPVATQSNGDTVTYTYSVNSAGGTYVAFYGDKIPYAGYFNSVNDVVLSWDGESRTPSYRGSYDTASQFGSYAEDSVYTNVNSNGHLVLDSEFMLRAYRGWQIVNSTTTNVMIEPEFNYSKSNDCITITPYNDREENDRFETASGTSSNNWVYLTPKDSGITYLEIGYDAVHIVNGWEAGGTSGAAGQPSNFTWNASDENRTALLVVQTDGNAASGINFGIQSPSGGWDYEYDTVYFTESQGSVTMKPTGDVATVSVSHDKGGSYQTITGTDGTYTVPIIPGNNIIQITDSDGKTAFQVVRGAQISYTVTNLTNEGQDISVGDEVRIDFHGIHTACPKISGVYNPGYPAGNMLYYKVNGTTVVQSRGYQYNFHNNVWLTFEAGNADCVLTGGNMVTPPAQGKSIGALYQASGVNSSGTTRTDRNILPDITIKVAGQEVVPATGITLDKETVSMSIGGIMVLTALVEPENTTDAIVWTSSEKSVATVENGTVTAHAAGETIITVTAGDYSDSCTVEVTDQEAGSFTLRTGASEWTVENGNLFQNTAELDNITVSGPVPVGDITGGKGPEWSVNVQKGTGDTVTVTMTGVAHTATIAGRRFWYNGTCSDVTMAQCTDGTFTVTLEPVWTDGTTTLTLGLGTDKKIMGETYTITMTRVPAEEEPETYTVTFLTDERYSIIPVEYEDFTVPKDGDFRFTVEAAEGYDVSNITFVTNTGVPITCEEGIYTISGIAGDVTVAVDGVVEAANTHAVTLPEGDSRYTIKIVDGKYKEGEKGELLVEDGGMIVFTVTPAAGYEDATFAVSVNGEPLNPENGAYTLDKIDKPKEIMVTVTEAVPQNYTVSLTQGTGYILSKLVGYTETVTSGGSYGFTVKVKPSYVKGAAYAVKVNGSPIQPQEDGNYLIENITENKNISVTGVEPCMTNSVDVYLSVSKDSDFITKNNKVIALQKLTVPYFDLALYGLEEVYYNPDCYAGGTKESQVGGTPETANGNITSLHLFIYATEVIYNKLPAAQAGKGWLAGEGEWNGYSVNENWPGSVYGNFWDFGEYNTYFLNYNYPLGRATWGAACDQILLKDGDIISVRYKNTAELDQGTYYHFGESGLLSTTAKQGEQVNLTLYKADENYTDGASTTHSVVTESCNVYVTADSAPTSHAAQTPVGTTVNGQITLDTASLTPGTYYVTTNTHDPAVMMLIVEEGVQQPTEPEVTKGDLNGNEGVDELDVTMLYNAIRFETDVDASVADMNSDGIVDELDVTALYNMVRFN